MLKSPTIIVLLSISPFMSFVFVLCIDLLLGWVHRYLQLLRLPLGLILDHYVVSFLISCNLLYFKVYFVWYEDCYSSFLLLPTGMESIFPSSHFSLYVSLGLKSVSCRQHIYGSCFGIYSASLYLLVGAFNPIRFKVIIDVYTYLLWSQVDLRKHHYKQR